MSILPFLWLLKTLTSTPWSVSSQRGMQHPSSGPWWLLPRMVAYQLSSGLLNKDVLIRISIMPSLLLHRLTELRSSATSSDARANCARLSSSETLCGMNFSNSHAVRPALLSQKLDECLIWTRALTALTTWPSAVPTVVLQDDLTMIDSKW